MRVVSAVCLSVAVFCVGAVQADETQDQTLQGAWQLSSGEANGKALTPSELSDGKLVIEGDHYTLTMGHTDPMTGTQKLGMLDDLKIIDITIDSGEHKGDSCLGIYETNGDEFRVVFAPPGQARPTTFEPAPHSGQWMHVWTRAN